MNEMIQLLNGALKGDARSFNQLYEMTHQKAYYIALKYMKDEHQAEDVLQEAYIKAFNNLNTLQNANKFEPWLHKIVYTTAMDVYRKRKRQAEHSINFTDYEGESETSVEFEDDREEFKPEEQMDYQETQKAVLGFIDELSSSQRMAMILFYYEQYSLKEIADVMECSVGTVKSRLNKAKQLMREMVNGYEKKHGVALHALPLFPFFAWAFKNAAETSTVHAAPLAYTATAAKNIASHQVKEKVVEKAVPQKAAATKLGASTVAKKAAIAVPKAVAKKIAIGVVATGIAGGSAFGAGYAMQQKQQANQESKQAINHIKKEVETTSKEAKTTKQKKETKTKRQIMLEAYADYLKDKDEETRFYLADVGEDHNPVLLIGYLNEYSEPDYEEYDTYDLYEYKDGKVITVEKDLPIGAMRGLYLAQRGNEKYLLRKAPSRASYAYVRNGEYYIYVIPYKLNRGNPTLVKGDTVIKEWENISEEELKNMDDSFKRDENNPIQFYKNTKENREKYCK